MTSLQSLPQGYRAAVFGASGGVGGAFVRALCADPRCARVHAGARRPERDLVGPTLRPFAFDFEHERSIADAAAEISRDGPLHLIVVATGILHGDSVQPEKTWRSLHPDALARVFAVNTIGPAIVAKHMLPCLSRTEKAVFAALSARVGSISDNRLGGWHAYRASKAALNMLVRTFAIELARSNRSAVCVALHPGTVSTALSAPYRGGVANLLAPETSARNLLSVIDALTPEQSGRLFGWDGEEILP
jgi:NAD(P)-dependent dehydrogenase (short-subunit alcohol dehydrogenase family)